MEVSKRKRKKLVRYLHLGLELCCISLLKIEEVTRDYFKRQDEVHFIHFGTWRPSIDFEDE